MQSNFLLVSALMRGRWLVFEDFANMNLPAVEAILNGKEVPEAALFKAPMPAMAGNYGANLINPEVQNLDDALPGSIAVIPVCGVLMRSSLCYSGMLEITNWLDQAAANPNIVGVIQYVNSGGGTVDYTDVVASKLSAFPKPVVTYTDGYMCSAAYWIGSSSNHIMVGSKNAIIGSIGTMWELSLPSATDTTTKVVRASRSVHKNESMYQAKKGNDALLIEEQLDPINENFLATIQENRAGKLDLEKEDVLTGKVYIGKAAITHGLADSFGTFEDAVQKVLELASAPKSETTISINQSIPMKKQILAGWAGLLAIMGLSVAEGAASVEADLSEEKLAEINAKLEENTSLSAKVLELETAATAAATAAAAEKTQLQADLKAAQDKAAEAEAKAAAFGAQPGATPTNPVATEGELTGETKKETVDPEAAHFAALGKIFNS